MINHESLELNSDGQICLALAHLRLMDVDISSSPTKQQELKLKDRQKYVELLGTVIPQTARAYTSSLTGSVGLALSDACRRVSNPASQSQIVSEIALSDPWTGKSSLVRHKIDDHVRRIVLKELATNFLWLTPDSKINTVLDDVLPDVKSATIDFGRVLKLTAAVAGGAVIGGLVLAPHIGAAIGAGMGLSGAAATSAGLAALGFGSLASGGLGMAGGMMVIGITSGVIGGGATTLATASSSAKLDESVEIQKLRVALSLMMSIPQSTSIATEMIASLRRHADALKKQEMNERQKTTPNKETIKRLAREQKLVLAAIPK